MNLKQRIIWIISFLFFFTGNVFLSVAQPIITELNALTPDQVNSFSRFTVTQETPGATEATVNFSYTYDGKSGPTALIYVIPISKDYPKSGIWFGSDPFTVSTGRGVGAVKISYFQDEPNAPITLTTEKIRVLVVSNAGRGVVSDLSFTRKVQWGNASDTKAINSVQTVSLAPDPAADPELIQRQKEIEAEKLRLEREQEAAASEARMRRDAEREARKKAAIQEVAKLQALEIAKRIQAEQQAIAEANQIAEQKARQLAKSEAENQARLEKERLAQLEIDRLAKIEADRLAKVEQEILRQQEAARLALLEADRIAKLEEEKKARLEAERLAKLEAERLAKMEAERLAKIEAERLAKLEEDRLAKIEADRLAKLEEDRLAKIEADRLAKLEQERLAKLEENERKAEMERLAKLEVERLAKIEADRIAKLEAERLAKIEADKLAKLEQERLAKIEADLLAKLEAERLAQIEADRLAKLEQERLAQVEADRLAKLEEERLAKIEADRLAKLEAERLAQVEADRLANLEAERLAQVEADRLAKLEEDRLAKIEADRLAKLEAERKAKLDAERQKFLELLAVAESRAAEMEKQLTESEKQSEAAATEAKEAEKLATQLSVETEKVNQEAKSIAKSVVVTENIDPLIEPEQGQFSTRITHVDVVNRSRDRTSMTIGVEFEMKDRLNDPEMGVRVTRKDEPRAFQLFESEPEPVGRSRRNFLLLPVRFNPSLFPSAGSLTQYATDQIQVYLKEANKSASKYKLFDTTMLLHWETDSKSKVSQLQSINQDYLEIDTFKKNDLYQGYLTVRYRLVSSKTASIRVSLFNSEIPDSRNWMECETRFIDGELGLELLNFKVFYNAKPSTGASFSLNTILIEMVDADGKVLASINKDTPMTFALPPSD